MHSIIGIARTIKLIKTTNGSIQGERTISGDEPSIETLTNDR